MTKQPPHDTPKALDAIADVVLAYKPQPKSKPAKKRKKQATKMKSSSLEDPFKSQSKKN